MTKDLSAKTVACAAPKYDTDFVNLMPREQSTRHVSHTLSNNAANINLSTTRTALLLSPLALAACGGSDSESFDDRSTIVPPASSWILSGFLPFSQNGSDPGTFDVFAGQINSDGRADFIITPGIFPPDEFDAFSPVLVLSTNDGYEVLNIESDTKFTHAREVAFFDFDNDGDIDIFIVGHGYDTNPFPGEQNGLLIQQDNGSFLDMSYLLPQKSDFTHSLAVGDINKDGYLDIYVGNIYGASTEVPYMLINDKGTGFIFQSISADVFDYTLGEGRTYTASLLSDVDDDGDLELILGGDGTSNSMILRYNIEDSDFEIVHILPKGQFESTITVDIKTGDLNSDGRTDIVMSQVSNEPFYYGRGLQILLQQEDGSFVDSSSDSVISFDRDWLKFIELIDFDGDGDLDIIGEAGQGMFLFVNNGTGSFYEANNGKSVYNSETYFPAIDAISGDVFGFKFFDTIIVEQFV